MCYDVWVDFFFFWFPLYFMFPCIDWWRTRRKLVWRQSFDFEKATRSSSTRCLYINIFPAKHCILFSPIFVPLEVTWSASIKKQFALIIVWRRGNLQQKKRLMDILFMRNAIIDKQKTKTWYIRLRWPNRVWFSLSKDEWLSNLFLTKYDKWTHQNPFKFGNSQNNLFYRFVCFLYNANTWKMELTYKIVFTQ